MSDNLIDQLLISAKTIAVVGISNKPERDSYKVANYLQAHGYRVLAINPQQAGNEILGEMCYPSLRLAVQATGLEVDIVDCFRKAEDIPAIFEEAQQVNAKSIWMQLGIVNERVEQLARASGMQVVMDRCTKIEHKRLHHILE
ncbi:CoA-binding protein [Undibacterium sp. FT137W]|uniref:CoA-binding protein n=2 Tax=Undibacterium fentianense TaxID=2828728 RepID=A0A941E4Q5_9BURK|nr:CoA-binding protein [Undibacterium fentianense]